MNSNIEKNYIHKNVYWDLYNRTKDDCKYYKDIIEEVKKVDYAFLDATFYSGNEINKRDISEIPHPFIVESIEYFEKIKNNVEISFIHFNHTNPLLNPDSDLRKKLNNQGYGATFLNQKFEL